MPSTNTEKRSCWNRKYCQQLVERPASWRFRQSMWRRFLWMPHGCPSLAPLDMDGDHIQVFTSSYSTTEFRGILCSSGDSLHPLWSFHRVCACPISLVPRDDVKLALIYIWPPSQVGETSVLTWLANRHLSWQTNYASLPGVTVVNDCHGVCRYDL